MKYAQVLKACQRELKYQALGIVEGSRIGPLHIPGVFGGVGTGKTSLAKFLAMDVDLPYVQINSGEASDGTDMTGVPFPTQLADGSWVTTWAPNDAMHRGTQEPVFLHFDDCDKARPPAQNALIGLTGERAFRNTKLHPGTLIFLSGNRTEDDKYAIALSESIRTRITTIVLDPSPTAFAEWGKETGLIHPLFRGYVQFNGDHLHVLSDTAERHTTPRGYREASDQLFNEPQDVWKEIMSLKLGTAVANDIWAYHEIYSKVDVPHVMQHGTAKTPPHQAKVFDPNDASHMRRFYYAALFAVSHALNENKYVISKQTTPGLVKFIKDMQVELRVAFLVQLSSAVQAKLSTEFEDSSALLMAALVN